MTNDSQAFPENRAPLQTRAILYACLAYLTFSLGDAGIKFLGSYVSPFELVGVMSTWSVLLTLLYSAIVMGSIKKLATANPKIHLLRGVLMLLSSILIATSLPNLPFPLFYALAFTLPFWAALWGRFLFMEKLNSINVASLCTGFVGVLIATQPDFTQVNPYCLAVLGAMCSFSLAAVLSKSLPLAEHALCLIFYPRMLNVLLLLPFTVSYFNAQHPWHFHVITLSASAAGSLGGILVSRAFQHAPASIVAPCQYSQIIWSTPIAFFLWGELPGRWTLIGGSIIVLSGWILIKAKNTTRAVPQERVTATLQKVNLIPDADA